MHLLNKYLPRTEFESYEDLKQNYRVTVPDDFNFAYDIIDEWAKLDRNKPALVWRDDNGHELRYTFHDLMLMSNKAANLFLSKGSGKGDKVMLILKQRVEVWVCMLALHKIGAVVIPATYQLTPKDIVYRCESAEVRMIVAVDEAEVTKHIEASLEGCTTLRHVGIVGDSIPDYAYDFRREVELQSDRLERIPNKTTDDMLIYFSSGTTGMPKMLLHDYSYPLGHIVTAKYWQCVEDGGLHLTVSDSGWAKFGWGKIYGQWICGAVIVAYDNEKFNARHMLETIRDLNLATFCAPPTIYRFLIREEGVENYGLEKIHHFCTAGEPLNPDIIERLRVLTGHEIYEGFGQSESTVLIANFPWMKVKPGAMGKPSPVYDIDIIDDDGRSCEDGIVGRVVIRDVDRYHPPGLIREYYRDKAANDKAFYDGFYDTGDTAWRDSDGYYWYVGRSDDVIKCSGYRIGPFEVENALHTHSSVLECAVTAAPDPIRGQVVKATIVLAPGYEPSDELKKDIQNHVKRVTAPYKYPRIIDFVSELPKTSSGKIRRVEIRARDHAEG